MRERIGAVRVDAELEHEHVGLERPEQRRHDGLERGRVHGIVGERLERQVDRESDAVALAHLRDEARAGKQAVAALVRGDGEHVRVVVERELDAVAVMRVDVDVRDAPPARAEPHDGEHGVVHVAETGRPVRHRVVEAAREVKRARHLAVGDDVGGESDPPATSSAASHRPREDGVVARPEAVSARRAAPSRPRSPRARTSTYSASWKPADRVDRGRRRRHHLRPRQRREPVRSIRRHVRPSRSMRSGCSGP